MPAPNKIEYVWDRIEKVTESGCWIWMGQIGNGYNDGYGKFRFHQKTLLAHRVIYEIVKGPIPEGLYPDHLCRVRCCVNPYHIELVTNRENILRGSNMAAKYIKRTHCNNGHELTPENTVKRYDSKTARRCRICSNVVALKKYHRTKKLVRDGWKGDV